MKLSSSLFILFIFAKAWSQNDAEKSISFKPEFNIAFVSHLYFGDNYLSKGHKKPTVGALLKMNFIAYKQFLLGVEYEKSTTNVEDFAIGGNIDKTNLNTFRGILSYRFLSTKRFYLDPHFKYGLVNLRQKDGSKFYGNQQGKTIGIGTDLIYNLNKTYNLFLNIGYNYSTLNVNTTREFDDYFNHAQSINFTIGLKIK